MKKINALGIGFSGMDIIKHFNQEYILPGGTCTNVISVLSSYLHCESDLIKCKYCDKWNNYINSLMKILKINIFECKNIDIETPRIIQVIDKRENKHYTTCPYCKARLINITMPSIQAMNNCLKDKTYDILFFDRISSGVKYLTNQFTLQDRWTFYEPNSMRIYEPWLNNIANCSIVKYSDSRVPPRYSGRLVHDLNCMPHNTKIILVTHAEKGFSYSLACNNVLSDFKTISVKPFRNIADSSGAGDWLSAGFIFQLLQYYPLLCDSIEEKILVDALMFGHTLSEICCDSIGALGGLFDISKISNENSIIGDGYCDFCKSKFGANTVLR